jgi:hypothetical protein
VTTGKRFMTSTNDEWTVTFKVPREQMQLGKINGSFEGLYFDEYGLMAGILNKRSKLIEPTYILKWEKK